MDEAAVLAAIRLGLDRSEPVEDRLGDWPFPWLSVLEQTFRIEARAEARIVEILRAQSELQIFDGCMQQIGNQARRVSFNDLARWLISSARSVGPERALADVKRYVAEDKFPADEVCALAGIKITQQTELGDGITFLPFEQLPSSPQKDAFTPKGFDLLSLGRDFPSAALTCVVMFPKHHAAGATPGMVAVETRQRDLEDARMILTLIGPSAPVPLASWAVPATWVPLGGWTMGWSSPIEEAGLARTIEMASEDLRRARELYLIFKALSQSEKQHLRVPIHRLNRALRRGSVTDSAIELGVALEALFLNDLEEDRGELTFRLRVRAARFLGTSLQERRQLEKLVGQIYRLRSAAVHTGAVPQRLDGTLNTEILEAGYGFMARSIEKMMREGSPNWSEVVLG